MSGRGSVPIHPYFPKQRDCLIWPEGHILPTSVVNPQVKIKILQN